MFPCQECPAPASVTATEYAVDQQGTVALLGVLTCLEGHQWTSGTMLDTFREAPVDLRAEWLAQGARPVPRAVL